MPWLSSKTILSCRLKMSLMAPSILHRARDGPRPDLDEAGGDSNQVLEALIAAGHQPGGSQLSTHLDHHPFVERVAAARAQRRAARRRPVHGR